LASFYLTYLHQEHTLTAAVTNASVGNGSKNKVFLSADVVFRNDGNRPQVLLGAELLLRSELGISDLGSKPPIILKPGEAAVLLFRGEDGFESLSGQSDWDKEKMEGKSQCVLRLVASGRKGTAIVTEIPVFPVRFDGHLGEARGPDEPRKIEWIELLR
jgi:hypothetical protein